MCGFCTSPELPRASSPMPSLSCTSWESLLSKSLHTFGNDSDVACLFFPYIQKTQETLMQNLLLGIINFGSPKV